MTRILPLSIVVSGLISIQSWAQTTPLSYTIAPWLGDKKAAVSLTFDDAVNGQFTIALPLLNQYRFTGTFFVTTGFIQSQLGSWQLIQAAAQAGHEIANHTVTHPSLSKLPDDSLTDELVKANQQIDAHIPTARSLTHAYPNGDGGGATAAASRIQMLAGKHFIGARATQNRPVPYNPYDFAVSAGSYFTINSAMIGPWTKPGDVPQQLDSTIRAGGWYVATYHGIENGWLIVKTKDFTAHLEACKERRELLWIAPFVQVLKYHKERNCAQLQVVAQDRTTLTLALSDTLTDNSVWNQPLSLRVAAPRWSIKSVRQAGTALPFVRTGSTLLFDAVPDQGPIVLERKAAKLRRH